MKETAQLKPGQFIQGMNLLLCHSDEQHLLLSVSGPVSPCRLRPMVTLGSPLLALGTRASPIKFGKSEQQGGEFGKNYASRLRRSDKHQQFF